MCPANAFGSIYIRIPAINKENDDHNPQRIAPRNLFDASLGHDNLFRGDRYKWSLRFTVVNLTNKTALYNFFSTFSGTHYVTPRAETIELGFHFLRGVAQVPAMACPVCRPMPGLRPFPNAAGSGRSPRDSARL